MLEKVDLMKEQLQGIDIRFDEPLKKYTYTKVGGPADYLVFPRNRYELARVVHFANQQEIPWMVLGNASNIIVRDGGIRGFVIMFDKLNTLTVNGYTIEAEAGANLIETTHVALYHSLTGFEFACGIPGSVGGAVFMNAGAYGGEIAHLLVSCKVLTPQGELKTISGEDMKFGYRQSLVQETGDVVVSAKFALAPGNHATISQEMNRLTHLRELKQPLEHPSCGSVFKRPLGHFAGQLISEAGLKGHRIGGVEVSTKHAGFMVNVAGGSAQDYEDLIAYVIEKVADSSAITLEPEVRIIGEYAADAAHG
ncbi:UDP-N-acetylmuramate dehydrogenase [Streptococcus massiliensis]|uniref:UDP-N-acetylenolpyruvoylglucosamine reductase n=1 Tax=Streptococcus massiliensis TaxID=313439 RepID=A0A380KW94_9STRE|nr:UDP-N-acetylmuramate dehydrogenase [Streptococcus massiliensis]SUN76018.1 UDP-N-acetylenolpyruvoylglucosamine reductase [Streptococcus massiliensis]